MSQHQSYKNTIQCQACFDVHENEPPIYIMPCGVHTVNFDCLVGMYNANLSIDSKTKEYKCDAHCPQCRKSSPAIKGDLSNIQIMREEFIKMKQDPSITQFKCHMCETIFESLFDLGVHKKKCDNFPIKCFMQSPHTANGEYDQCNGIIYGKSIEAMVKHKYNSCKYSKCNHHRHHIFPHDKIQLHETMCKMTLAIEVNGNKLLELSKHLCDIKNMHLMATEKNFEITKNIFVASVKAIKLIRKDLKCFVQPRTRPNCGHNQLNPEIIAMLRSIFVAIDLFGPINQS